MKISKKIKLCLVFLGLSLGIVTSCSSQLVTSEENKKSTNSEKVTQQQNIVMDLASISSIEIRYKGSDKKELIKSGDQKKLAEILASAVYDTNWNDRGIAVKMMEPDYTLKISYKEKPSDMNDWLMIWKESGRVRLKKWYLLPDGKKEEVAKLLDVYKTQ